MVNLSGIFLQSAIRDASRCTPDLQGMGIVTLAAAVDCKEPVAA
jgi:hypothetical protein